MNRRERRKRKLPPAGRHPTTGQRPHDMTSDELRTRLVDDAVVGVETPLEWALNAYLRIAQLDGIGFDAAYIQVRQQAASLGVVTMPGAPGS